jgi:ketosteroid isomerase-like protein
VLPGESGGSFVGSWAGARHIGEAETPLSAAFDLGDSRMLLIGHAEGRSPRSSVALANDWCFLWTLSAGRVSREELFFGRGEAFRAAGLEG